jgi:hypothetical protein
VNDIFKKLIDRGDFLIEDMPEINGRSESARINDQWMTYCVRDRQEVGRWLNNTSQRGFDVSPPRGFNQSRVIRFRGDQIVAGQEYLF